MYSCEIFVDEICPRTLSAQYELIAEWEIFIGLLVHGHVYSLNRAQKQGSGYVGVCWTNLQLWNLMRPSIALLGCMCCTAAIA